MTTKHKRITVEDLEKLVKDITELMKRSPFEESMCIDNIQFLQDGKSGPELIIIMDDVPPFTWSVFDDFNLSSYLQTLGWTKITSYDGDNCERWENHRVEGELREPLGSRDGIKSQFYASHVTVSLNAVITIVHNSFDYTRYQRYPAYVPSLVYKLAMKYPSIKGIVQTHIRKNEAVDFVYKYLWNTHEIMIDHENFDDACKELEQKS